MSQKLTYGGLFVVALISVFFSCSTGGFDFNVLEVFRSIFSTSETLEAEKYVLLNIRIPRVLGAFIVGSSLALSGSLLQGLFRNPLADPSIIGISSGAAMCAVVLMAIEIPAFTLLGVDCAKMVIPLGAFFGALVIGLLAFRITRMRGNDNLGLLLLCGIAFQFISMAVIGIVLFSVGDEKLRTINFWMMGSLGAINWFAFSVIALLSLPLLMVSFNVSNSLNALSMGEGHAVSLGTNIPKVKGIVIISTTLAIGASVAYCGIIGFIGLVGPHIARLLVGSNYKRLIPISLIIGGVVTVVADMICRVLFKPEELPLSIITSIIGAPILLALIIRSRKKTSFA